MIKKSKVYFVTAPKYAGRQEQGPNVMVWCEIILPFCQKSICKKGWMESGVRLNSQGHFFAPVFN